MQTGPGLVKAAVRLDTRHNDAPLWRSEADLETFVPPIQWTDDLLTGVEAIDADHKQLFIKINQLLEACGEGRGRDEVGGILEYLEDYTRKHFELEERHMKEHGYSGMASHIEEHEGFLANVMRLRATFDDKGAGPYMVVLTNRTVTSWLTAHIRKTDTELAEFLRTRGI